MVHLMWPPAYWHPDPYPAEGQEGRRRKPRSGQKQPATTTKNAPESPHQAAIAT